MNEDEIIKPVAAPEPGLPPLVARTSPAFVPTLSTGIAAASLEDTAKSAKKEEIYFAWSGAIERTDKSYTLDARDLAPGTPRPNLTGKLQGHYYRIQTPTFLIEYNNTQNNANHIHSVWRDFAGDWGRDLLAEHYQEYHQDSAEKKTE